LIDAELNGHTPSQTLAYLSAVADHEDEVLKRQRSGADYVVTAPAPWWRKWRLFW
jgi:hypothetical protein